MVDLPTVTVTGMLVNGSPMWPMALGFIATKTSPPTRAIGATICRRAMAWRLGARAPGTKVFSKVVRRRVGAFILGQMAATIVVHGHATASMAVASSMAVMAGGSREI